MSLLRTSLSLVLVLVLAVSGLLAQSGAQTGQITGTVTDPNGAVVPGAKITIINAETGATREVTSDESGLYRAVLLSAGRYNVTVNASGFAPSKITDVVVNVGTSVDVNVTLKLGTVAESVEVTAPMVEVTRYEPGAVVNMRSIENLPINGRRFQDFVNMTPTAVTEPSRGQISILGQRGINTSVNIDGADYNQPFFGGIRGGERSNSYPTVPQDAIAEFQVVTAAYSPEFGRSTGGLVTAITKSGTNNYHGSAFYYLRHKELGVKDGLNRQSLENRHQFGGSFGGPIVHDRAFFYGAVERQDQSFPRRVFFPLLTAASRTAGNAEAWDYLNTLQTNYTQTNDASLYTGRFDYQFKGGHRLFARYNGSRNDAENAASVGNNIDPAVTNALSNNGKEMDRTHTLNGQLVSLLSPNVANELRIMFAREVRPREANVKAATVQTTIGRYGTVSFLPTTQDDNRFQISDNLSWQKGSHSLKFGFEYNYITVAQLFGFNQFGVFNFTTSGAANVVPQLNLLSRSNPAKLANRFDDASVTYNLQIGNLQAAFNQSMVAFFAQDSWRVNSALTMTFGLRYEGQFLTEPNANNPDTVSQVRGVRFPLGGFDPTKGPELGNQWMPRGGFAWDPWRNGKTVIRGNAGIFYATTPMLVAAGPYNNFRTPAGDLSIALPILGAPAGRTTVYQQLLAVGVDLNTFAPDKLPVLTPDVIQRIPAALGVASRSPFFGAAPTTWAPHYNNPRSFQMGLGVERELRRGLSAFANFNYANTVHLQRNRDINIPAPVIRATDAAKRPFFGLTTGTTRPVPFFGAITLRESSARSLYRGASFGVKYYSKKVQFQASYTTALNYSNDDNERDAGGFGYENGFDLRNEYNYSNLDPRHTLTGSFVYSLPWGIEASSIWVFRSGLPFSATTGADSNGDRGGPDRPYSAPGVPFVRNSFRNRSRQNVDARVLKSFSLWNESSKLQFSAEMFNVLNFDNVSIGASNFVYGAGIDAVTGNTVAPNASFARVKLATGAIDPNNTVGVPFQFQAGIRLVF